MRVKQKKKRKKRLQPNSAMGSIVKGKLQHRKKLKKTIVIETLVSLLHV